MNECLIELYYLQRQNPFVTNFELINTLQDAISEVKQLVLDTRSGSAIAHKAEEHILAGLNSDMTRLKMAPMNAYNVLVGY